MTLDFYLKKSILKDKNMFLEKGIVGMIRRGGFMVYRFFLFIFLFAGLLFFSRCGNPPPPEFFSGTAADSQAIRSLVNSSLSGVFSVSVFEDSLVSLDSASRVILWRYARSGTDRSQAKFLTVGFQRHIFPDSTKVLDTLLFIKDTTATLILRRSLVGELVVKICSITPYDADSGVYEPYFVFADSLVRKRFTASTWQWGHFEPLKKDTSERVWRLVKVTGCQVISIPDEENSPIIPYPVALLSPGKVDSVYPVAYYRDSTKFGDRRLYYYLDTVCLKKDSLLFFTGGQRLTAIITPWLNPDDTVLKFISCSAEGGERRNQSTGVILPSYSSPTFTRVYLDVLTCEALTYEKKDLRGIIWGVATKIK